jgi:chromo domain-containing protein 1
MSAGMFIDEDEVVSSADDDNESLASSIDSDWSEDHEFPVDRILAEKKEMGSPRYLLSWMGYPTERATWEPKENIADFKSMSRIWETRKSREANGLDEPFDVEGYEATVARLREEKDARVARRAFLREARRKEQESGNHAPVQDPSALKPSRIGQKGLPAVSLYVPANFMAFF